MTDPFLIAHKVRGEPAFDVAVQMECPECGGDQDHLGIGCHECDSLGYWWIIPTSGHRAYPWWSTNLLDIDDSYYLKFEEDKSGFLEGPGPMPSSLPDHYTTRAAPKVSLAEALGIKSRPVPSTPIVRRF